MSSQVLRHFFLSGPSGVGKSAMLKEALAPFACQTNGFFTQRLLLEDGSRGGFRLMKWEKTLPISELYRNDMTELFVKKTKDGWEKNTSVFAVRGVKLLKDMQDAVRRSEMSGEKCILYMDELGGMELLEREFSKLLYQVLKEAPCCVGVVKSPGNLNAMMKRTGIKYREEERLRQFHREFTGEFAGQIVTVTEENKEQVRMRLKDFLNEKMKDTAGK